jgi:TonB-dependent starch-binding outer membrane protein SusC
LLLNKYMISKLRVYVSTQNLFTITKYTGLDPEVGVQGGNATQNGVDAGTYPSSRYYTVGVNVTF